MKLKKNEKRLLIILGIVLIIVVIFQLVSKKKKTKPPAPTAKVEKVPQNAVSSTVVTNNKPPVASSEKKVIYDTWGDDPFLISFEPEEKVEATETEGNQTKESLPEHKFLGVFKALGNKYALIDDLVIAEGGIEEGIEVLRVEDDKVIYRENGRTFTLYWSE